MKNLMKVAATICLCLILLDGYGQSNVPSNDNTIENEFVCFSYDGGTAIASLSTINTNILLLQLSTPKHSIIKRSSWEDIMKENEEADQMMNVVGQIEPIEVNTLVASKN